MGKVLETAKVLPWAFILWCKFSFRDLPELIGNRWRIIWRGYTFGENEADE